MNEQESVAFFPSLKEEVTVSLSSFPFLSEGIEILAVQFQSVSGARVPCATSSLLSGVVNIYEICWVFACELYAFTEIGKLSVSIGSHFLLFHWKNDGGLWGDESIS